MMVIPPLIIMPKFQAAVSSDNSIDGKLRVERDGEELCKLSMGSLPMLALTDWYGQTN